MGTCHGDLDCIVFFWAYVHMNCSLNSLNRGYIGDFIGEDHSGY